MVATRSSYESTRFRPASQKTTWTSSCACVPFPFRPDLADLLRTQAPSARLNGIVIPKVQTAEDVQYVSDAIDAIGHPDTKDKVKIVASIESALALMNIKEVRLCPASTNGVYAERRLQIATASPRVDSLLFAAEDYCADVSIKRTDSRIEMLYARSAIVNAAKAYGLKAIDLVSSRILRSTRLR